MNKPMTPEEIEAEEDRPLTPEEIAERDAMPTWGTSLGTYAIDEDGFLGDALIDDPEPDPAS